MGQPQHQPFPPSSLPPAVLPRLEVRTAHRHVSDTAQWPGHHPGDQRRALIKLVDASATRVDWMEWQASYAAGALLMPISRLETLIAACLRSNLPAPMSADGPAGRDLAFMVSPDAAAVRLAQLGHLAFHDVN
jgi:hypothetical protein